LGEKSSERGAGPTDRREKRKKREDEFYLLLHRGPTSLTVTLTKTTAVGRENDARLPKDRERKRGGSIRIDPRERISNAGSFFPWKKKVQSKKGVRRISRREVPIGEKGGRRKSTQLCSNNSGRKGGLVEQGGLGGESKKEGSLASFLSEKIMREGSRDAKPPRFPEKAADQQKVSRLSCADQLGERGSEKKGTSPNHEGQPLCAYKKEGSKI